MPTLRKRLLVDEWVAVAPERADRPRQLDLSLESAGDYCPFCPTDDATPPMIQSWASPDFEDAPWGVRAVPNKYPALRVEEQLDADPDGPRPPSSYRARGGVGAHEVIIEAPTHRTDWHDFSVDHLTRIFGAWQDRMADLRGDRRLRSALCFKNQGAAAGATLEHVHSQLVALPMIAPQLRRELRGAERHHETTGACELCEVVDYERRSGSRIVADNDQAVALTPFGSRMAFETWILPASHQGDYLEADAAQLRALAGMTRRILRLWRRAIGDVAYNLVLHSLPFDLAEEPYYHWHLELLPRTGHIAGLELGSDIYVNATPSEVAAHHLRNLVDDSG